MIALTRLDGREFVLNSDHVLSIEATPDTVITLTTGAHVMVKEPVEEVVARIVRFRRTQFEGVALHGPTPHPQPKEP